MTQSRERKDALQGTPYEPIKVLGSGAMGTVYLALHRMLRTEVCVKLLHAELSFDEGLVDRFRIEAQALASLGGGKHPQLVHVRDFGVTAHGQPFLAMEYLVGETLLDVRKARGEVPWEEACGWVVQALKGVAVAHQAGIVHRDLKPANLFLCRDGEGRPLVKVLDFGIAKILRDDAPVAAGAIPTAVGLMVGTPRYAAPEQARGEQVDTRSDVYSMGLVLHELLIGKPPFADRKTADQILMAQALDELPLTSSLAKQALPPGLDAVIARAVSKRMGDRFADASELATALRAILTGPPLPSLATIKTEKLAAKKSGVSRSTVRMSPEEQAAYQQAAQQQAADQTDIGAPWFLPQALTGATQLPSAEAPAEAPASLPGPGSITRHETARRQRRSVTFIIVTIVSILLFASLGWWVFARWLS